jgi:exodeoxyribonuclease VII large subunit
VERTFPDEVWVQGAISGLKRPANGHVYFDLIDPVEEYGTASGNLAPVVLFASDKHRVNGILRKSGGIRMSDGVEIRIRGRVSFYPRQGRVQLVMSLIDPAFTMGRMARARAALLETLRDEGLLGANGRLEIPALPLRIGLVTSAGSAANADVADELAASGYRFEIVVFDTRVQGADAVAGLSDAIETAGRADLDVVAVVRGGGARTDLAAFDHEEVARAIALCPRPVVVGVGHEIDRSVADEVAHTSAKTPTATAAVLIDAVRAFEDRVEVAATGLAARAAERLEAAQADLTTDGRRLVQASERALERSSTTVAALADRLRSEGHRAGERAGHLVDRAELRLRAFDPAINLERGWSITHRDDGRLARAVEELELGSTLVTTLASGTVTSTITALSPGPHRPTENR